MFITITAKVHQWEDNIRMDLKERGWEGVDWRFIWLRTGASSRPL
jgi:hypothetical protein